MHTVGEKSQFENLQVSFPSDSLALNLESSLKSSADPCVTAPFVLKHELIYSFPLQETPEKLRTLGRKSAMKHKLYRVYSNDLKPIGSEPATDSEMLCLVYILIKNSLTALLSKDEEIRGFAAIDFNSALYCFDQIRPDSIHYEEVKMILDSFLLTLERRL